MGTTVTRGRAGPGGGNGQNTQWASLPPAIGSAPSPPLCSGSWEGWAGSWELRQGS